MVIYEKYFLKAIKQTILNVRCYNVGKLGLEDYLNFPFVLYFIRIRPFSNTLLNYRLTRYEIGNLDIEFLFNFQELA